MTQSVDKSMIPSIRKALPSDAEGVTRVWMEGAKSAHSSPISIDSAFIHQHFVTQLSKSDDTFSTWVAEGAGGEILGWQSLSPCRNSPLQRDIMAESSTYISEMARGQGVGRLLMATALEHSKLTSLRYIMGFVAGENSAMLHIAKQLGWELVGTVPGSPKLAEMKAWQIMIYTVPQASTVA